MEYESIISTYLIPAAKYAGYAAAGGIAVAIVGKALTRTGEAIHSTAITKLGNATFAVAELTLKAVLVPPVAVAIGTKWFLLEVVPKTVSKVVSGIGNSGGTLKRGMTYIYDRILYPVVNNLVIKPVDYFFENIVTPALVTFGKYVVYPMWEGLLSLGVATFELLVELGQRSYYYVAWFMTEIFYPSLLYALYLTHWFLVDVVVFTVAVAIALTGQVIKTCVNVVKQTIDFVAWVIEKTLRWLGENVFVPIGRGMAFGAKKAWVVIEYLLKKLADGTIWTVRMLADWVFIPLGKLIVNIARAVYRGACWTWEHVCVPLGRAIAKGIIKLLEVLVETVKLVARALEYIFVTILAETILIPFGKLLFKGIVWLVDFVIASVKVIARALEYIFVTILVETILIPFGKFIFATVKVVARAIETVFVFLVQKIFVPLFRFIATVFTTIVRGVVGAAVWFWKTILFPLINIVWQVIVQISSAVARLAVWFWWSVLYPLVMGLWAVVRAVGLSINVAFWAIVGAVNAFVQGVVVPAATAVASFVRVIVVAVVGTVSMAAVAAAAAVAQIVQSVAAAVWGIVAAIQRFFS